MQGVANIFFLIFATFLQEKYKKTRHFAAFSLIVSRETLLLALTAASRKSPLSALGPYDDRLFECVSRETLLPVFADNSRCSCLAQITASGA